MGTDILSQPSVSGGRLYLHFDLMDLGRIERGEIENKGVEWMLAIWKLGRKGRMSIKEQNRLLTLAGISFEKGARIGMNTGYHDLFEAGACGKGRHGFPRGVSYKGFEEDDEE